MSLPLFKSAILLTALSIAHPTRAQEDPGSTFFASGSQKSLTLDQPGDGTASVSIVVRTLSAGASFHYGEFDPGAAPASFEASATAPDGEVVTFPIGLRIAADSISVTAEFPDTLPPEANPSGTYKKLSPAQHLAFTKAGYREADDALNSRWTELKKTLPADAMADLTKRQRSWIEHKEYMSQWGITGEKYQEAPAYWESAWTMTLSRLDFFDTYVGTGVPPGIAGVYVDEHSGTVTLSEAEDGTFRFQINVVRGPTYHLGMLTGKVALSGGKGHFTDTDPDAFIDGKPCTVDFAFSGKRLELKCENTSYYHGARAYFDGTYFKTKAKPVFDEEEG